MVNIGTDECYVKNVFTNEIVRVIKSMETMELKENEYFTWNKNYIPPEKPTIKTLVAKRKKGGSK